MSNPVPPSFQMASAMSKAAKAEDALKEIFRTMEASSIHTQGIDVLFLFVSPHYADHYETIQRELQDTLKPKTLIGCTAAGVITDTAELENVRAISILAARLPGARLQSFYMNQKNLEAHAEQGTFRQAFQASPEDQVTFFLFPDPFSFDASGFLDLANEFFPETAVVGGLASAAQAPGENMLFIDGERFREGAVGLVLTGALRVETLVSQGCRPFGEPFIVTSAEENVIHQLGGKPPMEILKNAFMAANHRDQELARRSLFLGCAVNEYKEKLGRGDFVIRNVISVDQESGSLAIGDYVEVGQTVQFHVRDAESAHEDLKTLCGVVRENKSGQKLRGALVFSCNGRGEHMFQTKNHDISSLHQELGSFPAAGFFCAGELGPIGSRNFLHGFTSSVVLFYDQTEKAS